MWITFFNKKGRLLLLFYRCHILPGITTVVIRGSVIDEKKPYWQGPYNEHMESWGQKISYG